MNSPAASNVTIATVMQQKILQNERVFLIVRRSVDVNTMTSFNMGDSTSK